MDAREAFRHHRMGPGWAALALMASLVASLVASLAACGGGEPGDLLGAPLAESRATTPTQASAVAARASAAAQSEAASAAETQRPRIVQAPLDAELAIDAVAEFNVRVDGPPGLRYQWLRDGEPIDGAIGVNLQWHVTEADHLARFSVEVQSGAQTVRSRAATLRVKTV